MLWCREGVDVRARLPELSVYLGHVRPADTYWYLTATRRLPELSVYLGHVRPADTYWYLTATPELLAIAASQFEEFVRVGRES